jgi:hypothetical protein
MRLLRHPAFGQRAGAVAAALVVATLGFASVSDTHAQYNPKDQRARKAAPPPKGPIQAPRKGFVAPMAGPNRVGMPPRGHALGPNALQNPRTPPNAVNPNVKGFSRAPNTASPNAAGNATSPNAARPNATGPNANTLTTRDPRTPTLGKGPNAGPANAKSLNHNATKSLNPSAAKSLTPGATQNKSANVGPNSRFGNAPNRAFGNNQPGSRALGGPGSRGFTFRDPRMRAVNARTPQLRQVQRFTHRTEMFQIRARVPRYPLPYERDFTGIPPVSETRFVNTEMVCHWGADVSPQRIEEIARQHNLTIVAMQPSALTGGTLVHFLIGGNRSTRDVVRAMEAERIVSQPNYVYEAVQETAAAQSNAGGADPQYVANKLRLTEVHKIATGKDVMVAVIDSKVDDAHPELVKGIAERYDAVGKPDKPHTHGTGMAGAIVSQDRLMGIAPGARALAINAFSTTAQQSPQATTQNIIAGLEWAVAKGARVINMSFAGPYDPMLALALKKASEKGAILIAAVGNAGPKSLPLYPAADPHVIGVTAIDENDKLYKGSNIGAQVAVAAPGVDVMVPAPAGTYQLTTGTSVAAAQVSGVAALLLEKHPEADAQIILEVLTSSATRLGTNKRDDKLGWGLVDPLAALSELDARLSDVKVAGTTPAAKPAAPAVAAKPAVTPARAATNTPPTAPAPAAGATRPMLPRPGIYVPKQ